MKKIRYYLSITIFSLAIIFGSTVTNVYASAGGGDDMTYNECVQGWTEGCARQYVPGWKEREPFTNESWQFTWCVSVGTVACSVM